MELQEYPKALYRDGAAAEVRDKAEEDAQRADGFTDWHTDHESANRTAAGGDAPDDEPAPLTRDQMKAKADELGLSYAGNISNAKLAELIAEAQE